MFLDDVPPFVSVDALLRNNGYHEEKERGEKEKEKEKEREGSWGHNYVRTGFETEYFEIRLENNRFYVSSPMKNSIIQYKTSFNDIESAALYMESKLRDYYDL
jgi:hypothetical protein